ncbi:phospholipid-translocating ATPase [Fusarium heterosporum]|uniref:Phospholipid-translocating ATPase n=1 Tax=Fusarium heterosporum TaxID=42747 RepID=A0A8H5WTY7_FUSHE|nr:phospholipid-translocating ATPase [Fusarium heterosporum]
MGDKNETWVPSYDNCHEVSQRCPVEFTVYGDYLSKGATVFFTMAFALLFLAQVFQGFRAKTWSYMIWLGIGTAFETAGHVARYGLAKDPWEQNYFLVSYITLLLAPTLVAAAISVTFKHLVIWYGAQWSLLKPRLYPLVFVGTDFISIFIQIVGGGLAALNTMGKGSKTTQKLGEILVIGGVSFQVANMLCCGTLMLIYIQRRKQALKSRDPLMGSGPPRYTPGLPDRGRIPIAREEATPQEARKVRWFVYALGVAYVCIIIRCVYRIAETIPEIQIDVLRNEPLFLVFDAAAMLVSIGAVTLLHPCYFFPYLGVKKSQKNQGKIYQDFRMQSNSALVGQQQGHV